MKTIRYILAGITLLAGSSCSDYFEIDRPPQLPWTTVEELERAPIGAYFGLFSGSSDGWNCAFVNDRIVKASMGDDVGSVGDLTYGYSRETKSFNTYTEKNFVQLYKVIATANNALEYLEGGENPFASASPSDIENNVNRVIGELHFIRGYAYYILQTTFGQAFIPGGDNSTIDIPMPTVYAKSAQEARNPVLGTTQQVYDLIVRDLRKAKALLPEKFDAAKHHPSYQVRANRFAASGMLVRAYMQKGSYDSALLECNYIIDSNNGEYDLSEDPIQAFNKNIQGGRGKEVIFYAAFYDPNTPLPPPNHLSVLNQTWAGAACTWPETFMGFSTVKRFNWMNDPETDTTINIEAKRDKRFSQLIAVRYPTDKRLPGQLTDPNARASIKDYTTFFNNKYYRAGSNTNVPLIRLAEIYLTRSVLNFRKGNKITAASDLNIVRSRAWDEAVAGAAYSPVTSVTITEDMIDEERIIELFNEGDRIDYLRARKVPVPKGERGAGTDPYTSEDFVWYIPSLELNYNDAI